MEGPPVEPAASHDAATGAVAAVPARPGRLSEAYDVQKPVGKGGYAVVYKGVRREDSRVVAVKKVEIFEMSQKKRDRCLQEVTLLAQLSHPYIIQMLDAFIDENMLIIIFEWAPAGDLKRLIKKTAESHKTLDEPAIWGFFSQIVDGLRYMHAHRIMHRDIKPANVLVGANGALKLGDLGLGRQLSEQTMEAFSKVGTPYYVSPEVVRGAGYDWKSDVWSLGCLLFELACLRSPFEMEGANLYDVFQRISKGDYEPLPSEHFSPTLRSLVGRMLSVDPAGRPELEEVWRICQTCLQAQTKAKVDVHTAAEHIYEQLMALEALANNQGAPGSTAASTATSRSASGKAGKTSGRSGSGRKGSHREAAAAVAVAAEDIPPPPTAALRILHPVYFAESAAAMPGGGGVVGLRSVGSDEAQRQQLGTFLQVFAWLLKVGGWQSLAGPVEAHIEQRTTPTRGAARPTSRSRAATGPAHAAATVTTASPAPPPQRQSVAVCTNVLQGAEAARRAALTAGISTEFAPVTAVAAGYGRAVCGLLQDLLDTATQRYPLALPRPQQRDRSQSGGGGGGGGGSQGAEGYEVDEEGDGAMMTAASPLPQGMLGDGGDDELTVEALWGRGAMEGPGQQTLTSQPAGGAATAAVGTEGSHEGRQGPQGRRQGDSCHQGAGAAAGSGGNGVGLLPAYQSQVDPVAWRLEAERLAPQLAKIKISASALAGGGLGEWLTRWDKVKAAMAAVKELAPPVTQMLGRVETEVSGQLERLAVSERRVNSDEGVEQRLQQYRAARQRLIQLQQDVLTQQDLQQAGHAALAQLTDKLVSVQDQIQERVSGMDGALPVQQLKDAVQGLRKELCQLEVRLGVAQQALLAKTRANRQDLLEERQQSVEKDWPER